MAQEVIKSLSGLIEFYNKTPGGTVPYEDAAGCWIDNLLINERVDHFLARVFSPKGKLPSQREVVRFQGNVSGLDQYVLYVAYQREITGIQQYLDQEGLPDSRRERSEKKLFRLQELINERPLANYWTKRRVEEKEKRLKCLRRVVRHGSY
jgi:hypothetical protein